MANLWTVTDVSNGAAASFQVDAGETRVRRERETAVFYNLKSGNPRIVYGPVRPAVIETPPWIVTGATAYSNIMAILTSGNKLRITDDVGQSWTVMLNESVEAVLQDTPDRHEVPRWYITPSFIGVE